MQFITTAIVGAMLGLANAMPAIENRQFEAQLHFLGAAGTGYTISAPTTAGTTFTTGESHLNFC